jgi:3-oxoacyl-[acyl-carrier-protein] synthase-3
MRIGDIYIAGIGSCLPDRLSAETAIAEGKYDEESRASTGILSVSVAGETPAPDLAITAARIALRMAHIRAEDVAVLIHSSVHYQGPDVWSAHHYILNNTVGLPIPALEIRQGCNGVLAALNFAGGFLQAGSAGSAMLITAADNFGTPVVDRWRCSKMFALGDGGASIVLSTENGFAKVLSTGSFSNPMMEEMHRGGERMFPPPITMGEPLDLERRMAYWRELWAQGVKPPTGHMGDVVREAVERALADAKLEMTDIARVVHVHFGEPGLRTMFLDPIDVELDKGTFEFGRRIGHVGAVDVVAGLDDLWRTGAVRTGDIVLLLGATPGMEAGCALVEITRNCEER